MAARLIGWISSWYAPTPPNAELSKDLIDAVTFEPMTKAVTLIKCGHNFNENTAKTLMDRNFSCPLDRRPIESYVPNINLRNIVDAALQQLPRPLAQPPEDDAPAAASKEEPSAAAVAHFERARACYQRGDYEETIVACVAALSICATYDKAKLLLDMCLDEKKSEKDGSSSQQKAVSPIVEQKRDLPPSPAPALPSSSLPSPAALKQPGKVIPSVPKDLLAELISALGMKEDQVLSSTWNLSGKALDEKKIEVLIKGLQGCPHVTALIITDCHLDSKNVALIAQYLATNTSLQRLDMSKNKLGLEGIKAIIIAFSKNPRLPLDELNLRDTDIPEGGVTILCEWLAVVKTLQRIDLSDNNLSASSLEALLNTMTKNSHLQLRSFHLGNTPIFPNCFSHLETSLTKQKCLESLTLQMGSSTPAGHGFSGFKSEEDREFMRTACHQIIEDSKRGFPEQFQEREFEVYYAMTMGRGTRTFKRDINESNRNRYTTKQNNEIYTLLNNRSRQKEVNSFLAALAKITSPLVQLALTKSHIGDESVSWLGSWLKGITTLRKLDLADNNLSLTGVDSLMSFISALSLDELNLAGNRDGVCQGLAPWLANNKTLRKLQLGQSKLLFDLYINKHLEMEKERVETVVEYQFPVWRTECASLPMGVSQQREQYFAEHYTNKMPELKAKAALEAKQRLIASGISEITALTQALSRNPNLPLTELNLDGMCMGPQGASLLGKWLAGNKTLRKLTLSNNLLGTEGAKALAEALAKNPPLALQELDLRGNSMDEIPTRFALNDALPSTCTLLLG